MLQAGERERKVGSARNESFAAFSVSSLSSFLRYSFAIMFAALHHVLPGRMGCYWDSAEREISRCRHSSTLSDDGEVIGGSDKMCNKSKSSPVQQTQRNLPSWVEKGKKIFNHSTVQRAHKCPKKQRCCEPNAVSLTTTGVERERGKETHKISDAVHFI